MIPWWWPDSQEVADVDAPVPATTAASSATRVMRLLTRIRDIRT